MYSKLYDKAKEKYDRSEDYEVARIAGEDSKLKGQVVGALAGLAVGAVAKKKLGKLIEKNPKIINKVKEFDPGVIDVVTSNASTLPAALIGANYGGKVTSEAAERLVLKEIEDKRRNKPSKFSKYV